MDELLLPETIEIRSPQRPPSTRRRLQEFVSYFGRYTVQELRDLYTRFTGEAPPVRIKGDLIMRCADILSFPDPDDFKRWFDRIPPESQRLIWLVVRDEHVPVPLVEKALGRTIIEAYAPYAWKKRYTIDPKLQLPFLDLYHIGGSFIISIPPVFRKALLPWLIPPVEVGDCMLRAAPEGVWSNSLGIVESLPLLCESLRELLPQIFAGGVTRDKLIRNGFKKKELQTLRAASGFPPFGHEAAPDSVNLIARFILCMTNFTPVRPPDSLHVLLRFVTDFFNIRPRFSSLAVPPDRKYLELNILTDHLNLNWNSGYYLEENNRDLPLSRVVFRDLITAVAGERDRWFDAEALGDFVQRSGKNFSFCDLALEYALTVKASALDIGGITYQHDHDFYDEFNPKGILRYELLVKPLFKAYCFLFAALGLLDISFKAPPLIRRYREKTLPVSPYDGLGAIRITALGRWCLGLTGDLPPRPEQNYQAIADRELYLVTVQGNSLERQVYLDRIGQRLGEKRWRISPGSFIAGCENRGQIEERIRRFKLLIDPRPAGHWVVLFQNVLSRAGLFDDQREEAAVYKLPEDRALAEELLSDPALKQIALRAEGKLLVVPARNQRRFLAFLNEHGISCFQ